MASTNFTTHFSIPTPLGTDLTTPMDYNEAAEAVDAALFGAVTDAGNASEAAAAAVTTANAAADAVDTLSGDLSQEKAKIVALTTRVTNAENEIDDVRADSSDMITAYNEPTATASHAYAIGDYFIYNNTLYKATAAIAIGATIVPDTNCETTNVSSELIEINAALSDMGISTSLMNESVTEGSHACSSTTGYRYFLIRLDSSTNTYQSHFLPANTFRNSNNQFFLAKFDGSEVLRVTYVDDTHVSFHIVVDASSAISGLHVKLLGIK